MIFHRNRQLECESRIEKKIVETIVTMLFVNVGCRYCRNEQTNHIEEDERIYLTDDFFFHSVFVIAHGT